MSARVRCSEPKCRQPVAIVFPFQPWMADLAGYPYCDAHGLVVAAISADAPYAACTKCRKWIDLCDCGHALPLAEACRRATDRQVAL